jgi:phosphodiesterase/alkaline phosphatase D-like protein
MARNGTAIASVIIGILILAGIGYFVAIRPGPSTTPTSTPTSTPPVTTPPPTSQAGAPVVNTNQDSTVSNSTAILSGTVNPRGAQTTYWFEYGTSSSLTGSSQTKNQTIGSGFTTIDTPGVITGLAANTKYYFRVVARNSFRTTQGAIHSFTTTNTPPPQLGAAPTARTTAASSVNRATAILNGRINPNGAQTTYWFEYGASSGLGTVTALQSGGSGSANLDVTISLANLQPQTKYYFRINAQNQFGTVNGEILSFTTLGPPAATAPTVDTKAATAIATTTVQLNGTVNPNGADASYWFEYGTDSELQTILGRITPSITAGSGYADVPVQAQLTGLAASTRYYYRVGARNSVGEAAGDIVSVTTRP